MKSYRLAPEVVAKISLDAKQLGMSDIEYLEALVRQSSLAHTHYFAQQAAFQSFVAAGTIGYIAQKLLPEDQIRSVLQRASTVAAQVFGALPPRPDEIGSSPDGADPRVIALFEAFCPR